MLTTSRVRELYERHVRPLTRIERLQFLALIADELAQESGGEADEPLHDVMEFHGVGSGSRNDLDAQEYVHQLRGKPVNHEP